MNRNCKLVILDQVYCVFSGLHPDDIAYLYDKFGLYAKGYHFNPKYQIGAWDGKIRYFYKTGKTYVNLLDDILPVILGLKYKIKLEDRRKPFTHTNVPIDENFFDHVIVDNGQAWKFRNYQVELVNTLVANNGGVGVAGTGSGKTSMCAAIASYYERILGYRSIIIVPDTGLTLQTTDEYAAFGLDVGSYYSKEKDIHKHHVVSTWQSLQNNPFLIQQFQVVIVDECHGLRGKVIQDLLNEYGKDINLRFGVTGTLPKEPTEAMAVKLTVGSVLYTIPAHELINEGHLSSVNISIKQLSVNIDMLYADYLTSKPKEVLSKIRFKNEFFPDFNSEKRYLNNEKARLHWIANFIIGATLSGNTLTLVNSIQTGNKLQKLMPDSIFLHGKDDAADRKVIYDMFETRDDMNVIATVNIASTGLNIPRIFELISIDSGKSFTRIIQTIGRGLRKSADKNNVNFTDICSDLKYSKRHLSERIKFYKEAHYPFKKQVVNYTKDVDTI